MKHLKIFEEFQEFKKPSLFQRSVRGAKTFFGVENPEDRKELEKIHRFLNSYNADSFSIDLIKQIKEIKPGVILGNLMTGNVVVDCHNKTIMWKGKELELNSIEYEVESLYDRLKSLLPKFESFMDFFRPKPLGNVEQAKKDSLDSIRSFLKRYSGLSNVDGLNEQQLLDLIKGFARNAERSSANRQAADIWAIAKPLFR